MAHELTETNGRVEFAYRADHGLPWHGLGQPIPETDRLNVDAWKREAGMLWRVKRSKVRYVVDAEGTTLEDPANHVLFRSDTKARLGVVSSKYQTVQPAEIFELFRGLLRAGGLEMSAAGTIRGGQTFWATALIGEGSPVSLRDKIRAYLMISTTTDGSGKTKIAKRATRAVCANTIAMADAEGTPDFAVSHRSDFDIAKARDYMQLNTAAWDSFRHTIVRLANRPIVEADAEPLLLTILSGDTPKADPKVRESAAFAKILALFNGDAIGSDLDGVQGTAWGMLNAVTEYADHHARATSDENRLISAQWGAGNTLKTRALQVLSA